MMQIARFKWSCEERMGVRGRSPNGRINFCEYFSKIPHFYATSLVSRGRGHGRAPISWLRHCVNELLYNYMLMQQNYNSCGLIPVAT